MRSSRFCLCTRARSGAVIAGAIENANDVWAWVMRDISTSDDTDVLITAESILRRNLCAKLLQKRGAAIYTLWLLRFLVPVYKHQATLLLIPAGDGEPLVLLL